MKFSTHLLRSEDKKKKKGDIRKREEEDVEGFSDDDTEIKKEPRILHLLHYHMKGNTFK